MHFECSLSGPSQDTGSGDGSGNDQRRALTQLERRRVRRACIACRDRKPKCSGSFPSCVRCLRLGIDCQYPSSSRGANGTIAALGQAHNLRGSGSLSSGVASTENSQNQANQEASIYGVEGERTVVSSSSTSTPGHGQGQQIFSSNSSSIADPGIPGGLTST